MCPGTIIIGKYQAQSKTEDKRTDQNVNTKVVYIISSTFWHQSRLSTTIRSKDMTKTTFWTFLWPMTLTFDLTSWILSSIKRTTHSIGMLSFMTIGLHITEIWRRMYTDTAKNAILLIFNRGSELWSRAILETIGHRPFGDLRPWHFT